MFIMLILINFYEELFLLIFSVVLSLTFDYSNIDYRTGLLQSTCRVEQMQEILKIGLKFKRYKFSVKILEFVFRQALELAHTNYFKTYY